MEFNKNYFKEELVKWNRFDNNRLMPWKNEKDPYKIWISEIILQQTKVQQGLEYYNRFIKRFPTVRSIAVADENEVFKLWEGLGYYTRCKNIIATAKFINDDLQGKFPQNYEEILKLKGIGSYTASAIASFAYNLPHAVVDGNVFRVLSRYFGIKIPVDTPEGKTLFNTLANELLDKKHPGVYNQSIMDFGAVICKPLPVCNICPLNSRCIAYQHGLINSLPVKEKTIKRRSRWIYYLLISVDDKYYVRKRTTKDIWQNLYEFVLIESGKPLTLKQMKETEQFFSMFKDNTYVVNATSQVYKQQLTHQTIIGQVVEISITKNINLPGYHLISADELKQLPFPKFINIYLKDKLLSLNLSSQIKNYNYERRKQGNVDRKFG